MSWDAARKKRHPPMTDAQYQERLKSRCAIDANGCWLYTGFLYWNGYGDMCYRNKNWRIHRLAFHLFKGPIPKWHDVCHTCDVRHCCNPDHLWTGPRQLNNRDTRDKKRDNNSQKTHCPRGHSYAEHGVRTLATRAGAAVRRVSAGTSALRRDGRLIWRTRCRHKGSASSRIRIIRSAAKAR